MRSWRPGRPGRTPGIAARSTPAGAGAFPALSPVSVLSNRVSQTIAARMRRRFGLASPSGGSWPCWAAIPACPPMRSPQRTAMDKVAVSRAVARLLERGLLAARHPRRRPPPFGAGAQSRTATASTTKSCRWRWSTNAACSPPLDADERAQLDRLLVKLAAGVAGLSDGADGLTHVRGFRSAAAAAARTPLRRRRRAVPRAPAGRSRRRGRGALPAASPAAVRRRPDGAHAGRTGSRRRRRQPRTAVDAGPGPRARRRPRWRAHGLRAPPRHWTRTTGWRCCAWRTASSAGAMTTPHSPRACRRCCARNATAPCSRARRCRRTCAPACSARSSPCSRHAAPRSTPRWPRCRTAMAARRWRACAPPPTALLGRRRRRDTTPAAGPDAAVPARPGAAAVVRARAVSVPGRIERETDAIRAEFLALLDDEEGVQPYVDMPARAPARADVARAQPLAALARLPPLPPRHAGRRAPGALPACGRRWTRCR